MARPRYPQAAFDAKLQGTVTVDFLIAASGNIVHAEVRESIPGLDEAAIETVRKFTFEPARRGGRPVPAMASAPVTFRIMDR
jgi:protein TonB